MTDWYSVVDEDAQDRLVSAWEDAPVTNLETCGFLVDMARDQVWAFAPESEDDDGEPVAVPIDVPARLVYAQLRQAQNLWNAGRVSTAGDVGGDVYTYTPRPLDKTIRGMIRPTPGVPSVG